MRRNEGSRPGRLNIPTALVFRETGNVPLSMLWASERLRLVGNILCAPEGHPTIAVARLVAADDRGTPDTPATRAWNWAGHVRILLAQVDAGAPTQLQLGPHVNLKTWRPNRVGATAELTTDAWRSKVRAALFGPLGYLSRALAARLTRNEQCPLASRPPPAAPPGGPFATVNWASFRTDSTLLCGPSRVGAHTTMAHLLKLAAAPPRLGRGAMPAHLRLGNHIPAARARSEIRCSSQLAAGPARGETLTAAIERAGGRGFVHGSPTCQPCIGSPSQDPWHVIAECGRHDALRVAALTAAAALAAASTTPRDRALAECYRDIAAALHTPSGRAFIFLATLGETIDRGAQRCMPDWWAECLAPPPAWGSGSVGAGAAVRYTFPAFEAMALACSKRSAVAGAAAQAVPPAAAPPQAPLVAPVGTLAKQRQRVRKGGAAAASAAEASARTATFVSICKADGWPSVSRVEELESEHGDDFGDKDPRRFLYRVKWSNGAEQTLDWGAVENWRELQDYVRLNARGDGALFELPDEPIIPPVDGA